MRVSWSTLLPVAFLNAEKREGLSCEWCRAKTSSLVNGLCDACWECPTAGIKERGVKYRDRRPSCLKCQECEEPIDMRQAVNGYFYATAEGAVHRGCDAHLSQEQKYEGNVEVLKAWAQGRHYHANK